MVLQQNTEAPIWGKAMPNKNIKVVTSWNGKVYQTKSDNVGKWQVRVKTPEAGGPYNISFSDGEELLLTNILIGEVWICSGQSNMEMPVHGWSSVNDYEKELSEANYNQIRLFHIERATSTHPLDELRSVRGEWQECSAKTVANFSAVGYFFAKNIVESLNVPVGIISSSWGGTLAEAWTSGDALENIPYFKDKVLELKNTSEEEAQKEYEKNIVKWEANIIDNDKGFENKKPTWAGLSFDDNKWDRMDLPGLWAGNLKQFNGIVWFRKSIEIPENWVGKELQLQLGKIDDNDRTFFNGIEVGKTNGANAPRLYKIPGGLVKQGKAVITTRIENTGGDGGVKGEAADMKIYPSGSHGSSFSLAGSWSYKSAINLEMFEEAPQPVINNQRLPMVLYNAMINPLVPFAFQGVLWYQGETNADNGPYPYNELFPLMIRDWRTKWNKNFPFYYVQLANYRKQQALPTNSKWAELREAQLQTLALENTGMAVTIDIGDADDVHPRNKQDVGLRLALIARANTYGQDVAFSGPIFNSYHIEGDKIRIRFKYVDSSLKVKDNTLLKGFAIAGSDHVFYWADAVIEKNEVVVSSPRVAFPIAVRYAWANNPDCNLYNEDNLPASPFRTDNWCH